MNQTVRMLLAVGGASAAFFAAAGYQLSARVIAMPLTGLNIDGVVDVVRGDFNGDGFEDLFLVAENIAPTSANVNQYAITGASDCKAPNGDLGLIAHGDSKGNPQQLHLLQACFGEFHGAIHRLEVMNAEQAKQRDGVSLPQLVSGDVVLVPTEAAIDTFLYWDGKRYQLYLPDEVP
ncbi:MAG: hypothetical protein II007_06250 [Gammaproteobacteria bacterium]|nr:hypothetical protein [Gammaproteobacteria bacterium]